MAVGRPPADDPGAAPGRGWTLCGGARVVTSGAVDGDMRASADGADRRRRALVDLPWATVRQVHGAGVVTVTGPGDTDGLEADGLVTAVPGLALAVLSADCAPVALASPEGVVAVAHAGWRGLVAGVVEATVAAMRALGAGDVEALLGPCIGPECYAFGAADLDAVALRLGPRVRSATPAGAPALDVGAAVASALTRAGATLVATAGACTACGGDLWSWRARRDDRRQATVVWRP